VVNQSGRQWPASAREWTEGREEITTGWNGVRRRRHRRPAGTTAVRAGNLTEWAARAYRRGVLLLARPRELLDRMGEDEPDQWQRNEGPEKSWHNETSAGRELLTRAEITRATRNKIKTEQNTNENLSIKNHITQI
jgi:hypothetical protein